METTTAPADAAAHIISLLASLAAHDRRTRGHCERVRAYNDLLAEELGLSESDRDRLRWAALIHDIGKLKVSRRLAEFVGWMALGCCRPQSTRLRTLKSFHVARQQVRAAAMGAMVAPMGCGGALAQENATMK